MRQNTSIKALALLLLGILSIGVVGVSLWQTSQTLPAPYSFGPQGPLESTPIPTTPESFRVASSSVSTPTSSPTQSLLTPGVVPSTTVGPTIQAGISIGDDFTGLSDTQLGERLDNIKALGVTWLRFDADWSYTQRHEGGSYNWDTLDRIVGMARARQLQLLPILDFTPSWARSSNCNSNRCAPRSNDEFAAFAHAAVLRYAPQGVHAWEIWNEPNLQQFWQPAPNVGAYTSLLKTTYAAIKNADPRATVLLGGLAAVDSNGSNINPLDFLEGVYQAGGGDSFDAVAFHPYTFPLLPSTTVPWNAWQQMSNTSRSLRSILAHNNDSSKKIWITEFGAPTDGPGAVSEIIQATILADAVRLTKTYAWAGPLFVYTYIDAGTNADTKENFFGLLRFDGSEKPGLQAFRSAILGH